MLLLSFMFGFACGFFVCHQWGNHRAKYYKKIALKTAQHCDALTVTLESSAKVIERLQNGGNIKNLEDINKGIQDAMSDLVNSTNIH